MHVLHIRVKHLMHKRAFFSNSAPATIAPMPRATHQKPKEHARHFLKEWRDKLDITQERAMERLHWSQSKISRIENRRIPLTLDDLEAASFAYGVSAWALVNVNPFKEGEVVDMTGLLDSASPEQRKQVADFAAYVIGRGKEAS